MTDENGTDYSRLVELPSVAHGDLPRPATSPSNRLQDIRTRLDGAAEGPWYWEQQRGHGANCYLYSQARTWMELALLDCGFPTCDFIAHAREDIPFLLTTIADLKMGLHMIIANSNELNEWDAVKKLRENFGFAEAALAKAEA